MNPFFGELGSGQLVLWVINVLIHSTVLTAVLLCVAMLFRRRAAMRYWILCCGLLLVLASPAVSALVQSQGSGWLALALPSEPAPAASVAVTEQLSPANDAPMQSLPAPQPNASEIQVPDSSFNRVGNAPRAPAKHESAMNSNVEADAPVDPSAATPAVKDARSPMQWLAIIVTIATAAWAVGAMLLLMRMTIGWSRLAGILRRAEPITDPDYVAAFTKACALAGCHEERTPRLIASDEISGPLAAGIFAGSVVLPKHLIAESSPIELAEVLVHEVAHVVRRDPIVVLIQNLVAAIYWPHPLVRKLNRELAKAREEVCDNFVLRATDAPIYSRTLLSLAQLVQQPETIPGSVGFFASRWKLEQRVAGLLDESRDTQTMLSRRGWVFVLASTVGLLAAICAGTVTIATAQVSDKLTIEEPVDPKTVLVRGLVLKPNGSPASGAIVRSAAPVYADMRGLLGERFQTATIEVVADEKGQFEISVDTQPYGEMPVLGTKWEDYWKSTVISATLPGFAGQFAKFKDVEKSESITLRLVEDTPLRGRVIGLEGLPISGVTVDVKDILVPPTENLDAWLNSVKNGEPAWTAVKHISRQCETRMLGVRESFTSDENGEFEINGLGRERCIRLHAYGNGIAFENFQVVSRSMDPISWDEFGGSDAPITVYGAEFALTGRPSRPVIGTVKDGETGMPLADVDVAVTQMSGKNVSGFWLLPTKTNDQGKFKMLGVPKGKGNRLMVRPTDDQPYFMREIDVPDLGGMDPIEVDIQLHRGIWIEGNVVDKRSREPVAGVRVHYLPLLTNKYADELPEFSRGSVDGEQSRYQTDADGKYRLVGLPGPAVIGAQSIHKSFRAGVGYNELTVPKDEKSGWLQTYRNPIHPGSKWPDSMVQVDLDAETPRFRLDLELDPGQEISVSVVDESGQWLSGAKLVSDKSGMRQRVTIQDTPVDVVNLAPDESRVIVVHHEQRGLGLVHRVTAANIADGQLSLTARKCTTITGRLVNEGEPLPGVRVRPNILPSGDFSSSLATVTTDENGVFHADLLPGCQYKLSMEGEPFRFASFEEDIVVAVGEEIDLGTISLTDDRKFKRTEELNSEVSVLDRTRLDSEAQQVSGQVLDPSGKPITATLWFGGPAQSGGWSSTRTSVTWTQIGESAADGRFQISLPKPEISSVTSETLTFRIAATAEGLGFAWANVTPGKLTDGVTLQLVNDTPIRGRIVTLDGTPAADVRLDVVSVFAPDSLPESAELIKNAQLSSGVYTNWPSWSGGSPLTKSVVTDNDGRFQLSGLGSERRVRLQALGDGLAATRLSIVTREKPSDSAGGVIAVRTGLSESSYFAEFTHVAVPGRIVRGTVVDQTSGQPLPDVRIMEPTSWASRAQPAVTDAEGKFVIQNVPKATQYRLQMSPDNATHFRSELIVPDTTGSEPLDVDLTLTLGIRLRGRVVDEVTGEGVQAEVIYNALFPNDAIELLGVERVANPLSKVQTDADGRFEIAVLPGPGAISAEVSGEEYATVLLKEKDLREIFPDGDLEAKPDAMGQFNYLPTANGGQSRGIMGISQVQAVMLLNPSRDDAGKEVKLLLRRGLKVQGELFDPRGKPVSGVTVFGLGPSPVSITDEPLETNRFSVTGLLPGSERTLLFLNLKRSLGAIVNVKGDEKDTVKVELKPTGSVSGSLVNLDGDPITNGYVSMRPQRNRLRSQLWEATTDEEGRFQIGNLSAGVAFSLHVRTDAQRMVMFVHGNIRAEANAKSELGEFRQKDKLRFESVAMEGKLGEKEPQP